MAKPELGTKRQCQNCGAKFLISTRIPSSARNAGRCFREAPRGAGGSQGLRRRGHRGCDAGRRRGGCRSMRSRRAREGRGAGGRRHRCRGRTLTRRRTTHSWKRKRRTTTTSPTSSMATSPLTRKPERRRDFPDRRQRARRGPAAFLARGPCGRRKFAVIPPPSESKAHFGPIGARRFWRTGP